MKYNLVVCGGTFDHFHRGHKEFLRYILSISRKVLIGLTTDKYVKAKNNSKWVEDYQLRKQKIMEFLESKYNQQTNKYYDKNNLKYFKGPVNK